MTAVWRKEKGQITIKRLLVLQSIQENCEEKHKRAPMQIKAKCAEGGFGEVMSHTHPSAGLHYSQRQSFQCRQDRAAPGHPCIRCCLWLLPLSSQLCCWQWKIICVLLRLNVPRVRTSSLTQSMHKRHMDDTLPSAFPTYKSDRAGKLCVLKTSYDTDRETFDTREGERVFSPQAYFYSKSKSNQK